MNIGELAPNPIHDEKDEVHIADPTPNIIRRGYPDEIDPNVLEEILNDINNEEENVLDIPSLDVDISPIKIRL